MYDRYLRRCPQPHSVLFREPLSEKHLEKREAVGDVFPTTVFLCVKAVM